MGFNFLIIITGAWAIITIGILQRWSGSNLTPSASRGFGFVHIALAALGSGLAQLSAGTEPVYANMLSSLMVGFSSAVAGIYVGRGYFINKPN